MTFEVVAPQADAPPQAGGEPNTQQEQHQQQQAQPSNPPDAPNPTSTAPKIPVTPKAAVTESTRTIAGVLQKRGIEALTDDARFLAPGPGRITLTYTTATGARAAASRHVLKIAEGRRAVRAAGPVTVRVKLTPAGRRLLRSAKRITITLTASFTPKGSRKTARTRRQIVLRRTPRG